MRSYTDFSTLKTNAVITIEPQWGDWPVVEGADLPTSRWDGPSWGLAPIDMLVTMGPMEERWRIGTKRLIPNSDVWVRLVTYTYEPPFFVYVIQAEGWIQWVNLAHWWLRGFAGNIIERILWTLVVWGLAKRHGCMIPRWRDVAIIGRFFRE